MHSVISLFSIILLLLSMWRVERCVLLWTERYCLQFFRRGQSLLNAGIHPDVIQPRDSSYAYASPAFNQSDEITFFRI